MKNPLKISFYIVLFVAFIDYLGVGLIYPLFSSMLFDHSLPLLPLETSHAVRGFWLGLLICLMPLAQFFGSPFWGALSDNKGRKKPLQISLVITFLGYIIALFSVLYTNIILLLLSRIVIGFGSGNMSIVQACIADLSSTQEKPKNFGLYSMALGLGFTLGPFFGGTLAHWGYSTPFVFASILTLLNVLFAFVLFKETLLVTLKQKLSWGMGFLNIKKAFRFQGLRIILLCSFLHVFGWSYFFEFVPVYLISRFHFSAVMLGVFFGLCGGYYALSTGLLIRPLVKRFKSETIFFAGLFFTALSIFTLLILPSMTWIWPFMFFITYFVAFVWPSVTTIISTSVGDQIQGEALGILSSVNAAALVLSPLCSGSLVGKYPTLPMWVGGSTLLMASFIMLFVFRGRLFTRRS